jgi:hypothetical protein
MILSDASSEMRTVPTITQRVIAAVEKFPGYSAGYYCDAANVTRKQFHSVARRYLRKEEQPSQWVAYYFESSESEDDQS